MSYEFHKEEYKGYTISLRQDESPESPRLWSNLGTLFFWPRRGWNTGDEHPSCQKEDWLLNMALPFFNAAARMRGVALDVVDPTDEESLAELGFEWINAVAAAIEWLDQNCAVLAVSQCPQSGELSYGSLRNWDDSDEGFIYASRKDVDKHYGEPTWEARKEAALRRLRSEIETYSSYLVGNVAYYVIEDENDDAVDCVGGFYAENGDWDCAISEARATIDHLIAKHEATA